MNAPGRLEATGAEGPKRKGERRPWAGVAPLREAPTVPAALRPGVRRRQAGQPREAPAEMVAQVGPPEQVARAAAPERACEPRPGVATLPRAKGTHGAREPRPMLFDDGLSARYGVGHEVGNVSERPVVLIRVCHHLVVGSKHVQKRRRIPDGPNIVSGMGKIGFRSGRRAAHAFNAPRQTVDVA